MKTKLLIIVNLVCAVNAHAGSATWNFNPTSGDWNTAANWTPNTVPNGPADVASFNVSNTNSVALSAAAEVNAVNYNSDATAFITSVPGGIAFTVGGAGITNNSGVMQNFVAGASAVGGGLITFNNNATAGSLVTFINEGGVAVSKSGGTLLFENSSKAGSATIMNNGAAATDGLGATTSFHDDSSAEDATIIASAATAKTVNSGAISFFDNSTAGNSQIMIEPSSGAGKASGFVQFFNTSTAGNATITLEGSDTGPDSVSALYFRDSSTGGNATIVVEAGAGRGAAGTVQFFGGNGGSARLEIFGHGTAGAGTGGSGKSWGSIEGDGTVFIGSPGVAIGSNNLSTTFTGLLADGFLLGPLTKVGSGTLTLGGANTYSGGTMIASGALIATNTTGSATGSGTVTVTAGTLGGSGKISGPVTVGTGSSAGAFLAPAFGNNKQATLTVQGNLTMLADSTYTCTFRARSSEARTDLVIANGVTISGATISLKGKTQGSLTPGTVLTVISNTSANPISGTFSNLPDGAIVTVNGNNFQASYSGGDGNDLTLTVVP